MFPIPKSLPALALAGACALGRGAPVCERAGVEIRADGIRCQEAGVRLFADTFADTNAWPVVRNYENRLRLVFGHPARGGGRSLLVSGEDTPKCDTAWNVMTAPRPRTAKGDRYRLSFRVATTSAVRTSGTDTQAWWTSVRWQDAAGGVLATDRVSWCVPPGGFNEVRHEGAIPAGAAAFAVQLGFDGPNICEGRRLEVGDVRLEALDGAPRRTGTGWFCSEARAGGPVSWEAEVPAGCAVRFQTASADSLGDLASAPFRGPDGTAATYWDAPFTPKGAWVRYRAELRSDGTATPVLRAVRVGGREDRGWTAAGDGTPPRVRLLMPSPTTDARVPLKIGVTDDSVLDWSSLRVVVDGADATARIRREGDVLSLVDQTGPGRMESTAWTWT